MDSYDFNDYGRRHGRSLTVNLYDVCLNQFEIVGKCSDWIPAFSPFHGVENAGE